MDKIALRDAGDGVRVVTLTDPERRNAMGAEMGADLAAACAAVKDDPDVRAVIVTGEGSAFCAGADLPALFGDPTRPVQQTHDALSAYYEAFLAVHALPQPTIAAVNGAAVGAGLNLAMACDIRLAGADASFGATFSKIGLHPGGGCTWFLVRALGPSRALQTLLRGDPLDARRAVDWGLAEGPYDDVRAAAEELAAAFAHVEPELARNIKSATRLAAGGADLDAVLAFETWAQAASATSPRLQRWVDRFRDQS